MLFVIPALIAFTNSNTQKPVTQKNWDKCFFYG